LINPNNQNTSSSSRSLLKNINNSLTSLVEILYDPSFSINLTILANFFYYNLNNYFDIFGLKKNKKK